MRYVILHYHIFKNAGTTVEEILDRNFGERFHRFESSDPDTRIANDALLAYLHRHPTLEALSSHQIRYPMPAAPGFFFFDICFLRDPLDRIRSIYDYAREKPVIGDPVSELASRVDLKTFVEHQLTNGAHRICNVQTHLLSGRDCGESAPIGSDLDRATQTMLKASFLGVVDRFGKSTLAARHLLHPVFPNLDCEQPPVNVSRGFTGTVEQRKQTLKAECGITLYRELVLRNLFDLKLVGRARREVERRLRLAETRGMLAT